MTVKDYLKAREEQTHKNYSDDLLWINTHAFTQELIRTNYVKNFTWMGRPILQYPTDLMVLQELIWSVKPDTIIETGVAFGGLTIFCAAILQAIGGSDLREIIGIDIKYKDDNLDAINRHEVGAPITLIQGSSIARDTFEILTRHLRITGAKVIMVILDSNHTHEHVLQELKLYSPLVSVGSYIVVFDTAIEMFMTEQPADRPWGPGNNPATAVQAFLKGNDEFEVDKEIQTRALISAAPGGWLRRVKACK